MTYRRSFVTFSLIALVAAFAFTRGLVAAPSYTDAYYHYNAAVRLAEGQGFTEPYLWTYIGAPETLPESGVTPSHLYWMPMTSALAAAGMRLLNAVGDYSAAQLPFTLMFALTACVGFWLGTRIGGGLRHAWVAGLLTLFSGFYVRYWGTMDTFAPYALFGALCLAFMGVAGQASEATPRRRLVFWALAGGMAGLAHLTRADGLLLLVVGVVVIGWNLLPRREPRRDVRGAAVFVVMLLAGYAIVMLPWFARNLQAVGAPLPLGGTQAIWFTQYDDLFNYPPASSPQTLFADGLAAFLRTRWEAFAGPRGLLEGNLGTFIAVEGMVVMTPLMLVGVWNRRGSAFVRPFWLYALGLHLAMTLIFPYPGYRGGLLHSAAALVPWWAALAVAGLDDVVSWAARRRRHWNPAVAKAIFSVALVGLAVLLSLSIASRGGVSAGTIPTLYEELQARLPANARLIINDPAALYYYTGMGGVVTPNAAPDVLPQIAERYNVDYLVLEAGGIPARLLPAYDDPPSFLRRMDFPDPNVRLYEIGS